MKHAGKASLQELSPFLDKIRPLPGFVEKKTGIFYRAGKPFLHFHEDPAGLFADLRFADSWRRIEVTTLKQKKELIDEILAVQDSVSYLDSERARQSIARDPYWPKWDSPWWHMVLLWELGLASLIPRNAVRAMSEALDRHYLKFFPTKPGELPEGADPFRHVACHCQLGTIYQVLDACGVDVDEELPWIRPWFLKYQLPDGGLNCDEKAYGKPVPKSSIVSSLPPLEAVLFCAKKPLSLKERGFVDRGAKYLIAHRLFRSASDPSRIVNPDWTKPCFPRFYDYDFLRGLRFLTLWSEARKKPLPDSAVRESLGLSARGSVRAERVGCHGERTLSVGPDGKWSSGADRPASDFRLLRFVRGPFLRRRR